MRDYEVSWGTHRQGGFADPFGHVWLVGDKSPLKQLPPTTNGVLTSSKPSSNPRRT